MESLTKLLGWFRRCKTRTRLLRDYMVGIFLETNKPTESGLLFVDSCQIVERSLCAASRIRNEQNRYYKKNEHHLSVERYIMLGILCCNMFRNC